MQLGFETLGNATLVFYEEGRPVLATDPWLVGTCYFGSWGLDRPVTADELSAVHSAKYVWISHGHPDHLHPESLALLPKQKHILLPEHYTAEIADDLRDRGFIVEILRYRHWRALSSRVRCICIDNENQDAILIVEADGNLIVNMNDSPMCGERWFIQKLIRQYDRKRTYLAKLCAFDADMINITDRSGRRIIGPPDERKRGTVWAAARLADQLGVGNYVCSSSQHVYLRVDSLWANPYRVTWADIQHYWGRPHIQVIEPYVKLDLQTGKLIRKHPDQSSDYSRITETTADDDPNERLTEEEWEELSRFFLKFKLVTFDHLDFVVGGERRRIWLRNEERDKLEHKLRGFGFHVPRRSLLEVIRSGYFGDLLIGNFMKTELHNAMLWPDFTPIVAMLGSNAKVFTKPELRRFKRYYFRRNPFGYLGWWWEKRIENLINGIRHTSDLLGVKAPLKRIYRWMIGDPRASI